MSSGRVSLNRSAGWLLAGAMLCACVAAEPTASRSSTAAAPATPKRVSLVMRGDPPSFYYQIVQAVAGMDGLQDLVHVGFAAMSNQGLVPVLAEAVPTVENGLWKVFPDGQMETTWMLRPNARWHDGVPVTADDIVFTLHVATDKDLPEFQRNTAADLVDRIEARDARTIVAHWKQPFIAADWLLVSGTGGVSGGGLMPLPKHLLDGPYNETKSTFLRLPYWNQEFVGTGPFKVLELVASSHTLLTANDGYVLGRPKIDEIEVKFIPDSNAIVVNALAGVVDLTLGRTIALEQAIDVQSHGAIRAEVTPFNLQRIFAQFINPRPPIIADARFRRALLYAINRQEMIDTLESGLTVVPASILPNEDQYRQAEAGVAQYPYDPQRALQLIEELGYTKGAGGALLNASGEGLSSVEIRGQTGDDSQTKVLFSVVDYWQHLGLAVDPVMVTVQRGPAYDADKANRPGFVITGGPNGLSALGTLVSREIPLPENNYVGSNTPRYSNAEYDAFFQRYVTTIPQAERTQVAARLLQHVAANLPFLPLYYRVEARLVANRLLNVAPRTLESSPAWDLHQWDVQ